MSMMKSMRMKSTFASKLVGLSMAIGGVLGGCAPEEEPVREQVDISLNTIQFIRTADGDIEMNLFPENGGKRMDFTTNRNGQNSSTYAFKSDKAFEEFNEETHPQMITPKGQFGFIPDNDAVFTIISEGKVITAHMHESRGKDNQLNVLYFDTSKSYNDLGTANPTTGIDTQAMAEAIEIFNEAQASTFIEKPQP